MVIIVSIEREGRGEVSPELARELEAGTVDALASVLRGEGEYQARRISVRVTGGAPQR
jgi:hypothetical protein